jgi:uncharacterized protein YqgC (DUF456 family)
MLFGLDLVTLAAVALLAGGVVGSAIPSVPGPLVSLAGVVVYVLGGGSGVGTITLVTLAVVGIVAVLADWLAGSLAAKYGGASWGTSALAGVVGLVLLFVVGPVGVILGIAVTVFLVEAYRVDARHATKAAFYSTVGALGSIVVQVLLALGILATFVFALAI